MSDYFYYIAVLYIIYDLQGMIKTFIEDDTEAHKLADSMIVPHDVTDGGAIIDNLDTVAKFGVKKIVMIIISLLFGVWLIIGAVNAPDYFFFSALIVLNILNMMFPLMIALFKAINQKEEWWYSAYMRELKSSVKSQSLKVLCVVDSLCQYCVAGYLLYYHFWMQ